MIKEYSADFNNASVELKAYKNYIGDKSYPFVTAYISPIILTSKKYGTERKIPIPIDETIRLLQGKIEDYNHMLFELHYIYGDENNR